MSSDAAHGHARSDRLREIPEQCVDSSVRATCTCMATDSGCLHFRQALQRDGAGRRLRDESRGAFHGCGFAANPGACSMYNLRRVVAASSIDSRAWSRATCITKHMGEGCAPARWRRSPSGKAKPSARFCCVPSWHSGHLALPPAGEPRIACCSSSSTAHASQSQRSACDRQPSAADTTRWTSSGSREIAARLAMNRRSCSFRIRASRSSGRRGV